MGVAGGTWGPENLVVATGVESTAGAAGVAAGGASEGVDNHFPPPPLFLPFPPLLCGLEEAAWEHWSFL